MHKYLVIFEPKGRMRESREYRAYTAADALVQAKVFLDWQWSEGYKIHELQCLEDLRS